MMRIKFDEQKLSITRAPDVFVLCTGCGRSLAIDTGYDGNVIFASAVSWSHDDTGIYCDECRPPRPYYDHGDFEPLPGDEPDIIRAPVEREQAITDALRTHPDGLTSIQLGEITKMPRTTANRRLEAMMHRSEIEKKNSKYFLQPLTRTGQNL